MALSGCGRRNSNFTPSPNSIRLPSASQVAGRTGRPSSRTSPQRLDHVAFARRGGCGRAGRKGRPGSARRGRLCGCSGWPSTTSSARQTQNPPTASIHSMKLVAVTACRGGSWLADSPDIAGRTFAYSGIHVSLRHIAIPTYFFATALASGVVVGEILAHLLDDVRRRPACRRGFRPGKSASALTSFSATSSRVLRLETSSLTRPSWLSSNW